MSRAREDSYNHHVFWHLAAILNRYILPPGMEQGFVDVVLVRSMGDDFPVFDAS